MWYNPFSHCGDVPFLSAFASAVERERDIFLLYNKQTVSITDAHMEYRQLPGLQVFTGNPPVLVRFWRVGHPLQKGGHLHNGKVLEKPQLQLPVEVGTLGDSRQA